MESANDSNVNQLKKNWREISKGKATLITFCIVSIYTILHWLFIKDGYFLNLIYISTTLFFIGFAFGFFEVIEPGTTDTLVYSGKKLDSKWEDGYCFVPSILPFMHRLRFRPLWSLFKKHWPEKFQNENMPIVNHKLRIDSANQHRINTDATLTETGIYQIGKMFFNWFFSMNGESLFAFQEFGLKIIITAFLLDCFNLATASLVNLFSPFGV